MQGIEVQCTHMIPGLGEDSCKKGPLARNPGLGALSKGNGIRQERIHVLTGQTCTTCLPCIKQVRSLEHHSMEQRKPRPTQSSHGSCRTLCGQVMLGQSFHNEAAVLRTQSTKAHSCLHTGESPMKCEMPLPLFCLTNAYSFGGCLSFI